jgi:hypothetical protein
MDEQADGLTDTYYIDRQTVEWLDRQIVEQTGKWIDRRIDIQSYGLMDWADRQTSK